MAMKKPLLLALVLLLPICIVPLRVEASGSETWIVIVGSYEGRSDVYYAYVALRQYYNADPDTNIMYLYEYPADEIEVGSVDNGTSRQNVRWTIREWLKRSDEDDTIFIYFRCHGGGAYADGTLENGRIDDLRGDEGGEHYSDGTWFGVDECLWPNWGEQYWDDELADDLSDLKYQTLIAMFQGCKSENGTCFSGGFIDDLSALNRIIITASNETSESYRDLDEDGFSEFSEVFFDALFGYNTRFSDGIILEQPVDADFNDDGEVSILEAWQYAYTNDDARWVVGHKIDSEGYPADESPWFDDDNNGLPTFKAGCDIFLLGDFNFDGKVDVIDYYMFSEIWMSEEYHPLYDLNDDWDIDAVDLHILLQCLQLRHLTISASYGGTTDPSPGSYPYDYDSSVTVAAVPTMSYWKFDCWILDGSLVYHPVTFETDINPITVTMDFDHDLKAYFIPEDEQAGGGDTCPMLFVWNGIGYVDYGVIDIHDSSGEDVVREVRRMGRFELFRVSDRPS